jgi:hypothetical protein
MLNTTQTLQAKYANSPVMLALIDAYNSSIDPSTDIDKFYNDVWNIATAIGYGLDVWGRIVGVNRVVTITGNSTYIGFNEAGTISDTFGQAPFYSGTIATSSYSLSDDAFRLLILAKSFMNVSRASISTYNAVLTNLFPGRGSAYVTDTGGMNARINIQFALQPFEVTILKNGVITPPTGVTFSILQADNSTIGFAESGNAATFGNGTFFKDFL